MFNPEKEQHRKVAEDINRKRILSKEPEDTFNNSIENSVSNFEEKLEKLADVINEYKDEYEKLEVKEKEESLEPADYYKKQILEERIIEKQAVLEQLMSQIPPQEFEDRIMPEEENISN